jgi:hypothetical protein
MDRPDRSILYIVEVTAGRETVWLQQERESSSESFLPPPTEIVFHVALTRFGLDLACKASESDLAANSLVQSR